METPVCTTAAAMIQWTTKPMKTNRASLVLHMSFCLLAKGGFTEKEVIEEFGASRASFFRALSEFRCYLLEHRPWLELVFDAQTRSYRLVDLTGSK
jgi:hypothetical protein